MLYRIFTRGVSGVNCAVAPYHARRKALHVFKYMQILKDTKVSFRGGGGGGERMGIFPPNPSTPPPPPSLKANHELHPHPLNILTKSMVGKEELWIEAVLIWRSHAHIHISACIDSVVTIKVVNFKCAHSIPKPTYKSANTHAEPRILAACIP